MRPRSSWRTVEVHFPGDTAQDDDDNNIILIYLWIFRTCLLSSLLSVGFFFVLFLKKALWRNSSCCLYFLKCNVSFPLSIQREYRWTEVFHKKKRSRERKEILQETSGVTNKMNRQRWKIIAEIQYFVKMALSKATEITNPIKKRQKMWQLCRQITIFGTNDLNCCLLETSDSAVECTFLKLKFTSKQGEKNLMYGPGGKS